METTLFVDLSKIGARVWVGDFATEFGNDFFIVVQTVFFKSRVDNFIDQDMLRILYFDGEIVMF